MRKSSGFTLLEVVIAMVILAFLATFTAGAIQNAVRSKINIQKSFDQSTQVREVIRLIQRDLEMAYHTQDYNYKMAKEVDEFIKTEKDKKAKPGVNPAVNFGFLQQANPENAPPVNPSIFLGEKDKLEFTTLSSVRTRADSPISSQTRVKYYIETCVSRQDPTKSSSCLWRQAIPYWYEEIDDKTPGQPLLEHVETFELRYVIAGKDESVDQWKTTGTLDDATKDVFPDGVEIKLTVHNKEDQKDKPFTLVALAPIRFVNNPDKAAAAAEAAGIDPNKNPDGSPKGPAEGGLDGNGGDDGAGNGNDGGGNDGGNNGE
jgi:prepilin-type N-terminal cleavage/methylation domain-containing protein